MLGAIVPMWADKWDVPFVWDEQSYPPLCGVEYLPEFAKQVAFAAYGLGL